MKRKREQEPKLKKGTIIINMPDHDEVGVNHKKKGGSDIDHDHGAQENNEQTTHDLKRNHDKTASQFKRKKD